MPALAYGSWPSPITPELMTSSLVGLDAPLQDGSHLYWLETRADQGGRTSLWRRSPDGERCDLTPEHYVRSRVHEYGGGEYAVDAGVVVFSSFTDGRIWILPGGAAARPLTAEGDVRYGDLRVHALRRLVLAIREDHRGDGEAVTTIVAIDLDAEPGFGTVLCSGADFYSTPELSADGRLAWVEWDHPAMPWDSTRLRTARLAGTTVSEVVTIAGGPHESAVHPRWLGERLVFVSDRTGWPNLYLAQDPVAQDLDPARDLDLAPEHDLGTDSRRIIPAEPRALYPAEASFVDAPWMLGMTPYAVVDANRLLCTYRDQGTLRAAVLSIADGTLKDLDLGGEAWNFSVRDGRVAAVVYGVDRPPALVAVDLDGDRTATLIRSAGDLPFGPEWVSVPRAVRWASEDGDVHGWFYPPTNPDVTDSGSAGPDGELPPLVTISHGGPTGISPAVFRLGVQFWTTRGVAVLDVNYSGSTGYGRAYQERLRDRWGIADVRDCAAGAEAMGAQGLVDPARLAIMGGSAGGYTTLRALTATTTFAAGISLYGIGDLETLARDTHKFESRYLDGLVGPYPQARQTYRDRSPIDHVDDLAAPILLLQGTDDKVVPPNQAEALAEVARAKGLPVALVLFPGEGHGFRRADSIRASYEAQLSFLGQIFGFVPAGDIPPLTIENL
ncbi:MAG TPA: prolyl oligopeptidase family serine peptidase [Microlunatus sp.]|nr:prolyl oligopeptidase family serine peptidase [Microlunatus sp.]